MRIRPAEGWNNYQNYHPSDFCRTIDLKGDFTEEDFLEEDSLEEEDFLEEEDSLEEEDIQEEVEYHPEDCQGVVGDHHRSPCHKHNKGN